MATIEDARILEFLAAPRNAILATIRPSGAPQLSPVWFLWRRDCFVIGAGIATAKAANISRDPRISLCIDDQDGACYVTATGTPEVLADNLRHDYAIELIAKYKAPDEVAPHWDYLERNEPQRIYTFDPQRIIWRDYTNYGSEEGVPARGDVTLEPADRL